MLRNTVGRTACFFLFLQGLKGVFGAGTDEVKSVSVMEGDSVSLNSDVTEIQSKDQILWTFGPQETRIAEIHKQSIDMYDSNLTFGDRLQMDSQTGSLTIRNIRSEHTGLYKLTVIRRGTSYKRFNVTVYAPLPIPIITRDCSSSSSSSSSSQNRSLVCSVLNVSHVTLSWYKGISVLSSISVSDLSISLSLPLDVEYQDKNTYSCVINNPIRNQTTYLNITQLCQPCAGINILGSPNGNGVLAACISAALLLALAGLMYFFYRKHKRTAQKGETAQSGEDEVQYAETGFFKPNGQKKKANETEEAETIYSSIIT